MSDVRRLVVIRHASAAAVAASDLERELTPRGRDEAQELGRWLGAQGLSPDVALVSSAVRTRETWSLVSGAAGWEAAPDYSAALYAAGTESALDLVRLFPDTAGTAVLLGHNPTVGDLVRQLDDGQCDAALVVEMVRGYPPGTVTVLELPGRWDDADFGQARVVAFRAGEKG